MVQPARTGQVGQITLDGVRVNGTLIDGADTRGGGGERGLAKRGDSPVRKVRDRKREMRGDHKSCVGARAGNRERFSRLISEQTRRDFRLTVEKENFIRRVAIHDGSLNDASARTERIYEPPA